MAAGSSAEEATGDTAFLQAMLDAEAALTRAQARLGAAPAGAARTVTAAADATRPRYHVHDLALRARAAGNPVVPLVAELTAEVTELTAEVTELNPSDAEFVHRGATSQDILDTALMLLAARTLDLLTADLERAAATLAALAAAHRTTPMPGRTLTQHAVPTTFGLKAAGWRALLLDAHDRLTAVRETLPVQLGGAAGTLAAFAATAGEQGGADGSAAPGETGSGAVGAMGAGHSSPTETAHPAAGARHASQAGRPRPTDRPVLPADHPLRLVQAFAAELGLATPQLPWHTLRTPVADLAGALALTAGALGKIAADVLVLSRTEIGELAEGSGGGSSAMPHKSNPVRATLIAATARQVPALAAVLYGSLAAEDERPAGAWHAEWQPLRDALRLTGGAARDAAELCAGLVVRPGRMRENLARTGGLIASERLLTALTPLLGRAAAKDLLARASCDAAEHGTDLAQALRHQPEAAVLPPREQLDALLDPAGYVGAAPALTDHALTRTPARPLL
ncbi:lyase family protein [Streptomyces sp. NPDC058657]|uniref:lyase family protein n=1 Tax=unclassified Streptomyces TaxID=2593676 RepID=UPI00366A0DB0